MSAIGPHLEEYESTKEELAYSAAADTTGAWHGLSGGLARAGGKKVVSPEEIANKRHAGLVRMAMTRQAIVADLAASGTQFRAQFGDAGGARKHELFIVLDKPVGVRGPEWNSHSESLQSFKALSWTSKMDAPSFSLPAGPEEVGGACPGAAAGQTTSYHEGNRLFVSIADLVRRATPYQGEPGSARWFADSICQSCYAEGGNYAYGSKQLASILLFDWTRAALATPTQGGSSNEFIDLMVPAIQNADYMQEPLRKRFGRFFRIHDSGDFFSIRYLRAWKAIADAFRPGNAHGFEPIVFWAPTRMWAVPRFVDAVNEINGDPANLVIRPSAYHINTPALRELGPGWAQGSTVTAGSHIAQASGEGAFDWNCPAYDSDNASASCTASKAPPSQGGGRGCRACWVMPGDAVNYRLH